MTYSLQIKRYNIYKTFNSLEDLRAEVKKYFTLRDGYIVDKLTSFPSKSWNQDHWERTWQDYQTCAYPA